MQAQWDADKKTRAAAETNAVAQRAAENLALARQQAVKAAAATKVYDDEINDVRARLAAADPTSGLLPDEVARDIRALILQTEEVAAAGRACQAFVRANGMAR